MVDGKQAFETGEYVAFDKRESNYQFQKTKTKKVNKMEPLTHIRASLSKHIDPLEFAGAIFANTFELSFKLFPSVIIVMLPVSCHVCTYEP